MFSMRYFTTTIFLIIIILCYKNSSQGAIITKDIPEQPISLSASRIVTWEKNGIRTFTAEGNVKIEQGDVQITANSAAAWFTEVKVSQFVEGCMEVYCEGNVSLFQDDAIQNYQQMYLKLVTTAGVVVNSVSAEIQSFEEDQKTGIYLRGENIRADGRGEFASNETPKAVPPTGKAVEGVPIDIFADDIDTWIEKDVRIVVATGNVRIKKDSETLSADNVILYLSLEKGKEGELPKQVYEDLYAEGNVTLRRGKDVMIADKIFKNIKGNKGIFVNSIYRSTLPDVETPIYIHGEEIKDRGKGLYEAKNGSFSTCSYGHPHFRFQASNVRLFKTDEHSIVTAQKNVFHAGNIPLIYLPYLSFDIKRESTLLENWEFGSTSRFGRFVKTDWDIYSIAFDEKLGDWSDLTLNLDYLSLRGPAVGLDFEYGKKDFFGYMHTYYIRDEEDFDINDVPIETRNRGHFLWRHRQHLKDGWRADVEVSYVNDRSFFREYYYNEFKNEKDRETIFYLRKASDNKGITFLAEKQLKSYDMLVDSHRLNRTNESLPELKYRIIGEPLWNDRLNFTSETELAYLDRVFDRISPLKAEEEYLGRGASFTAERVFDRVPVRLEPEETIRFDTDNIINAPFRFFGVRFNPFAGIRLTGYSESVKVNPVTLENDGSGSPRGRIASTMGLNISTTFSRTYSIYNNFLNINRLRHIMAPEVCFNFMPVVTQDPEDLNQFDRIDSLDTYQSVVIGLRNRFQTKRGESGREVPIDFVDFNVEFNFFPGDAGLNRKRDEFVELDLKVRLSDKISLLSERNEFNLRKGGVDIINFGLNYHSTPKLMLYAGNRFIDSISSSVVFSSKYNISEKWHVALFEQFDFRTMEKDNIEYDLDYESQNLNTRFILSRFFHDWIGNLTIDVDETRDDIVTRFDILPRGGQDAKNRFWIF